MKHSSLSDETIRRLLDAVVADDSIQLSNKVALRRQMIDEFWAGLPAETPQSNQHSTDDPVVIELSMGGRSKERSIPWRRICFSAAAALLTVVGVVSLARDTNNETIDAASNGTPPTVTRSVSATGLLDPGRYTLGSVAGGVEFATPSDILVAELESGLIVLQPVEGDSVASLSLMSADDSIEAVLEGHRDAGAIRLIRSAAMTANGPVTEFEVRLQPGVSAEGCEGAEACLTIGRVTVTSGSIVTVREFLGPNNRRLWALYQSNRTNDPFQREANLIQESLVFTDDS